MKIIGVTGGVGAGKSTVLDILKKEYGAQILLADEIGKELMEPGKTCFQPVIDAFGKQIVDKEGRLDRRKISEIVFKDKTELERLNAIIHPAVQKEIELRLEYFRSAGSSLSVIESAILIEAGYEEICNEIWYIYVTSEKRIQRLMESRGYTREKCLEIMDNQLADEEFRRSAAVVIDNGGTVEETKEQIASFLSIC